MVLLSRVVVILFITMVLSVNSHANELATTNSDNSNQIISHINTLAINQRLQYLSSLEATTHWQPLTLKGLIKIDDSHPLIPPISQRLMLLQDLLPMTSNQPTLELIFTKNLELAIIKFQQRHGLKPDGIIGPNTLKWLNTSPSERVDLLTQNMQRQQSFFNNSSPNYLVVNIPQFQLSLIKQGQLVFESRVIVGQRKRPTPVIDAQIRNLVVNPAWNVPRSIIYRDIRTKIINNNNFLSDGNYEVFDYTGKQLKLEDYNWGDLARGRFPFSLRQKPGPTNTLGRVKFYFDNAYSVYLHDTQNKKLFDRYQRTFSSGCVRVEKALELAKFFANHQVVNQKHWQQASKTPYISKWLKLNQPLPIYLVYWTAWIDDNNQTQFRTDIYNKENNPLKNNNTTTTSLVKAKF